MPHDVRDAERVRARVFDCARLFGGGLQGGAEDEGGAGVESFAGGGDDDFVADVDVEFVVVYAEVHFVLCTLLALSCLEGRIYAHRRSRQTRPSVSSAITSMSICEHFDMAERTFAAFPPVSVAFLF